MTQRLWRAVEGPQGCLPFPCCWDRFNHEAREQDLLRYALDVHRFIFPSPALCKAFELGFRWLKRSNRMGKVSTPGVLRLRATSVVSRDKSVGAPLQDDGLGGVLTKNNLGCTQPSLRDSVQVLTQTLQPRR